MQQNRRQKNISINFEANTIPIPGVLAIIAKLVVEPVVGVFFGSISDSIGNTFGIPDSLGTSRAIVTGSLIRAGADTIDASIGYVAGVPPRESFSLFDNFVGFENVRSLMFNDVPIPIPNVSQPEDLSQYWTNLDGAILLGPNEPMDWCEII